VRHTGRLLKRLIDTGANLSRIQDRLLSRSFDLDGWCRGTLAQPPPISNVPSALAATATVRATRALTIGTAAFKAQKSSPKAAVNATRAIKQPVNVARLGTAVLAQHNERPAAEVPRASGEYASLILGDKAYPITSELFQLGRDPACHLTLGGSNIASIHAHIELLAEVYYIRDLGSETGTWVDEQMVTVPHPLQNGQVIRLGSTTLTFRSVRASLTPAQTLERTGIQPARQEVLPVLECRSGHHVGLGFMLIEERTVVGRGSDADIRLDDAALATEHALFERRGGDVTVSAIGANLVLVAGSALARGAQVALSDGVLLSLGPVTFAFWKGRS
jgi:pSer/pThr/pTyr-binding forkhead associated (FHA) protein